MFHNFNVQPYFNPLTLYSAVIWWWNLIVCLTLYEVIKPWEKFYIRLCIQSVSGSSSSQPVRVAGGAAGVLVRFAALCPGSSLHRPPPPPPLGITGSFRFNHTQLESLKRLWRVLNCPDIQRRKTRSFRVRQNFHSLTVLLDNKRTMSFFLSSSSPLISSNSDQNLGLGILTPNNQMRNLVWF